MIRNISLRLSLTLGLALAFGLPAHAQLGGPSMNSAAMQAAMNKLFGGNNTFTANAEMRMLDKAQKEMLTMTMSMSMLEGKMRAEIDMANLKSAQMPPEAAAQMKQMGMDKIFTISRPDKKVTYLVYPGLQSYVEMPMTQDEKAAIDKEPKIEKTEVGKETIDGHPCVKNKVIMTLEGGKQYEAMLWNASDLKDFPVQMQMTVDDNTITSKYKDIKFVKPDAAQFDPPAGMTKYDNMQAMMQTVMQKMMGGQGPK